MNSIRNTLSIAALIACAACTQKVETPTDTVEGSIKIYPNEITATPTATSSTIAVTATADWKTFTTSKWISANPANGDETVKTITIEVAANKGTSARMANMTFTCGKETVTLKVTQAAEKQDLTYSNPVISEVSADPSCIRGEDGYFYVFTTGGNVRIRKSKDLVNWELIDPAFNTGQRPNFLKNDDGTRPGIWAPDLNKIGDKYVMYYALHTDNDNPPKSGIGVAVADKPEGPYKDLETERQGLLRWDALPYAISEKTNRRGCIDPEFLSVDGKNYLFVGSFRGIFAFELSEDGLSLAEGAKAIQVAGDAYEGTYIYKRGEYYYFFASKGSTIPKETTTYKVAVGRSKNPLGPYVEKNGKSFMNNPAGYILLDSNTKYPGPGHNGEIITDDAGTDWLLYHAYTNNPEDSTRHLCIDKVTWDSDGWPVINGGNGPSEGGVGPVFRE